MVAPRPRLLPALSGLALLTAVALAVPARVARAQSAPAPPPAPPPEATVPADPRFPEVIEAPPGFDRDPAWSEYDGAFRDAAAGDLARAKVRLARLAQRWPGHPAEARARALIERREDPYAASNLARGELVFWSTVGGVSLAANLCVALECRSDRAFAGAYTLSIGGSLAASLAASRRGVRKGEAQLYNSAQTWGGLNALAINDGFPGSATEASVAIAMQAGGLLAGIGLWQLWRPAQGDVALTNTFLVWGGVLTVWGLLAADAELSWRPVVIAGDVSLLLGAAISQSVHVSRGRTFLIDVGGILGVLAGGLVATGTETDAGAGVALMVGTAAGLGIAAAVTRGFDAPSPPVQVAPAALDGPGRSRGYGLAAGFSF